jgi:hypothetical protein
MTPQGYLCPPQLMQVHAADGYDVELVNHS